MTTGTAATIAIARNRKMKRSTTVSCHGWPYQKYVCDARARQGREDGEPRSLRLQPWLATTANSGMIHFVPCTCFCLTPELSGGGPLSNESTEAQSPRPLE